MGIAILKEYVMMEKKDGKDLTTMKRILCFLLCAVLLLAMTACAQKTPAPDTGDAGQESAQAEPAPAVNTSPRGAIFSLPIFQKVI